MKKVVCFVLCLAMMLPFCSCGPKEEPAASSVVPVSSTVSVDIVKLASEGKIHGCEFDLGTLPDSIKEKYHYGDEAYWGVDENASSRYNIDAVELEIREGDPVRMSTADAKYYYHEADADKGISFMAYFFDPYELRVGISDTETVKSAVKATPIYDDFAKNDDLFIFFGEPTDVYEIVYQCGDYELSFFFENGKLSASALKNTTLW